MAKVSSVGSYLQQKPLDDSLHCRDVSDISSEIIPSKNYWVDIVKAWELL
jgi:hypothetical protein